MKLSYVSNFFPNIYICSNNQTKLAHQYKYHSNNNKSLDVTKIPRNKKYES